MCDNCNNSQLVEYEGFLVCSECGKEDINSNIIAVHNFSIVQNEKIVDSESYDNINHLKRFFRCLKSEQKVSFPIWLTKYIRENVDPETIIISNVRKLLKDISYEYDYVNVFILLKVSLGLNIGIDSKLEGDITSIYKLMLNYFKENKETLFAKRKKKFFTCSFMCYNILLKLKNTFILPYDPDILLSILKKPTKYHIKNNLKLFEQIWNELNLSFLTYKNLK